MSDQQSIQKQNAKVIQVFQNFFTKTLLIIVLARSASDSPSSTADNTRSFKINKWFNLNIATPTDEWLRSEIKLWKSQAEASLLPPMIIETYLDLRQLNAREIVMLEDENGKLWTVAEGKSKKQEVVIERWLIEFDQLDVLDSGLDELPLIYKQAIVLLRVVFTITRLLPAFKLKKIVSKVSSKNLALCNRLIDGKQPISSKGRIGLSRSIIPSQHLSGSHMTQKAFSPIRTTLGSLRVSVAYRNHFNFKVVDHEERLSDQFLLTDKEKADEAEKLQNANSQGMVSRTNSIGYSDNETTNHIGAARIDRRHEDYLHRTEDEEKFSVSPCTSIQQDANQRPKIGITGTGAVRPSIQPFKVGSISTSPPPSGLSGTPTSYASGSIERRISITSHRSGSNASLAALLRNPKGSLSSSNTPTTIAISNSQNNSNAMLFPRSISSSHGSHLQSDEHYGENVSSTPRFSSSFGSRQSRRFSGASGRNNDTNASLLGTSLELGSSGALLSGLYIDDDISSFVRMIDGKSTLKLTNSNTDSKTVPHSSDSNSHLEALSRFQLLKSQHQQLGDSVSASLILHRNRSGSRESHGVSGSSKAASHKSSHSSSPQPSFLPNSYDNGPLPSISSRLHTSGIDSGVGSASPRSLMGLKGSYTSPNLSYFKPSTNKLAASPLTATTIAHATHHPGTVHKEGIKGLATSPSIYSEAKHPIRYEDVFEDDEDAGGFYHSPEGGKRHLQGRDNDMSYDNDNDDLLFEMTDTK